MGRDMPQIDQLEKGGALFGDEAPSGSAQKAKETNNVAQTSNLELDAPLRDDGFGGGDGEGLLGSDLLNALAIQAPKMSSPFQVMRNEHPVYFPPPFQPSKRAGCSSRAACSMMHPWSSPPWTIATPTLRRSSNKMCPIH